MAFIRLKNNKCKVVPAETGIAIWRVMNGEIKGTKAQQQFIKQIHKVYLNKENAPKSYLEKHYVKPTKVESISQIALPYKD